MAKKKKKNRIGSPGGFPWQPYLGVHSLSRLLAG